MQWGGCSRGFMMDQMFAEKRRSVERVLKNVCNFWWIMEGDASVDIEEAWRCFGNEQKRILTYDCHVYGCIHPSTAYHSTAYSIYDSISIVYFLIDFFYILIQYIYFFNKLNIFFLKYFFSKI